MAFDLDAVLATALQLGASDLHLKVPSAPRVRIEGELIPLDGYPAMLPEDLDAVVQQVLGAPVKRDQFERVGTADVSYSTPEGRFRVAAFRQRGGVSFVFRAIAETPDGSTLSIPDVVLGWAVKHRGLIVVSGPTGSGKSTSCAAILNEINTTRACHIATIEDPIEFLHSDQRAIVTQREIGLDADSYLQALRALLRQDPDVIFIGEVRDGDTAMTALRAAETGHLVLCTMHTLDASETIQRFVDLFGEQDRELARAMLAGTLVGILAQRLIPGIDGKRRLNAEVLVRSARIRDLVASGASRSELEDVIGDGEYYGMQTFHQSLLELVRSGEVRREDALAYASHQHDFKLMLATLPAEAPPPGRQAA